MNFVRPLTWSLCTGPVRCTGTVVHGGRTLATAEGRLVDVDGKLYAHGTSTLLIVGAERPTAYPSDPMLHAAPDIRACR